MLLRKLFSADRTGPIPSLLVVVAHPDDEVIGAGAQLPSWPNAWFVHVTDGAPRCLSNAVAAGFATREEYSQARRWESEAALALAGIPSTQLRGLDFIDQEASFNLALLVDKLVKLILDLRPEAILTHPYEGGHPDHDSTAFAVHQAARLVADHVGSRPTIFEMTSYHNRAGAMATGAFLPHPLSSVVSIQLDPRQRIFKQKLFSCFPSQQKVLAAFAFDHESFRPAPDYDFTAPPHEGTLFYEQFNWGMQGCGWRSLARSALEAIPQSYVANYS